MGKEITSDEYIPLICSFLYFLAYVVDELFSVVIKSLVVPY